MLNYISKKVNKAYKASKTIISGSKQSYKQSQQYKLIRSLQKYDSQILPTSKLNQLATMTYQLDKFQTIFDIMLARIDIRRVPRNSSKELKQLRNTIIICGYLIKHGAGGFIDQFREEIYLFQYLTKEDSYNRDDQEHSSKFKSYVNENINRSKYLVQLLTDKTKLIKEKQISMLIKQKIKVAQKNKNSGSLSSQIQNTENNKDKDKQYSGKVDSFLQNYVWKYVNIIDGKLDQVADVIADQLQKYLLDQIPESFQIDQIQTEDSKKMKTEADFSEKKINQQKKYQQQRQDIGKKNPSQPVDLLQLQPQPKLLQKKPEPANLLQL